MRRLERQSFLGPNSDQVLANTKVGLVGLGGGGSHLVQQFAHLGIGGFVLVDPDVIDLGNTNRLVGGTLADVAAHRAKVQIAERLIRGLQTDGDVKSIQARWESALDELKGCDVIVGAVDSYGARDELERFARRYLIPYVDIGMDVLKCREGDFLISGQVILSSPGEPCLRCCNFITEERLEREAEKYGAAGGRPQVVWSNGILASIAVGIVVELLTPWRRRTEGFIYLEYDGNRKTVTVSNCVAEVVGRTCLHYPDDERGDPAFDVRHLREKSNVSPKLDLSGQVVGSPRRKLWWRRLVDRILACRNRPQHDRL